MHNNEQVVFKRFRRLQPLGPMWVSMSSPCIADCRLWSHTVYLLLACMSCIGEISHCPLRSDHTLLTVCEDSDHAHSIQKQCLVVSKTLAADSQDQQKLCRQPLGITRLTSVVLALEMAYCIFPFGWRFYVFPASICFLIQPPFPGSEERSWRDISHLTTSWIFWTLTSQLPWKP